MHQLIDKKKIYLYLFLLFILLSIHNINFLNSFSDYFKIKKIILISSIENSINDEIKKSLYQGEAPKFLVLRWCLDASPTPSVKYLRWKRPKI